MRVEARSLARWSVAAVLVAAAAGAAEPTLELQVQTTRATVGDRVEVRAVARGGDGLLWGDPQVELEPGGDWELVGSVRPVFESDPPAWDLTLAPMAVGDLSLPPVAVSARQGDGEPQLARASDPPTVTVASVLPPEEEAEPAPLHDPIGARGLPWEWIPPALVLALPLILVAAALVRRRRGLSTGPGAGRDLPPLTELEKAMTELRARIGRDPAPGLCDGLAGGLRRYLERRTGEAALEMTTVELRQLARRRGWPQQIQGHIHRVMSVADGVRFGRRPAGETELREAAETCLEAGRDLEAELRAREAAAAATEAGGGR